MDLSSVLVAIVTVVVAIAFVLMVVAYKYRHLQDMLLYVPQSPEGSTEFCETPSEHGIPRSEAVSIVTRDGVTLKGYFLKPSEQPPLTTIVYFHGNAGNVGHRLPIAKMMLRHLKCAVLMIDYRGYGLSDKARPTEDGLRLDGEAIIDFALSHCVGSSQRMIVMGTSLGGAVATHVASLPQNQRFIAGVILENTFTSISDMADALFTPIIEKKLPNGHLYVIPFCKYFLKPVVLFIGWFTVDAIKRIGLPFLFLSGARDEIVPANHMKALHEAAKNATLKKFVLFANGKHNDLVLHDGYMESIASFIREALAVRAVDAIEVGVQ